MIDNDSDSELDPEGPGSADLDPDPDGTPTDECPNCGKEIAAGNPWCPECGHYITKEGEAPRRDWWVYVALILIGLFFLTLAMVHLQIW